MFAIIIDMTLFLTLVAILQSFTVSLGVGASTLAIVNFFVAIADGTIEPAERKMMGIVYIVLRVAMVAILITTIILIAADYFGHGAWQASAFQLSFIITLGVLYLNAILMTLRIMPSTFGPSIQAGSWYTLGVLMTLQGLSLDQFTLTNFLMGYVTWLILAIAIVNGTMAAMKAINDNKKDNLAS